MLVRNTDFAKPGSCAIVSFGVVLLKPVVTFLMTSTLGRVQGSYHVLELDEMLHVWSSKCGRRAYHGLVWVPLMFDANHMCASFIRKAMLFGSEPTRYQHAQNRPPATMSTKPLQPANSKITIVLLFLSTKRHPYASTSLCRCPRMKTGSFLSQGFSDRWGLRRGRRPYRRRL